MQITKVTRDGLIKIAKEYKIYLEGNILKIIDAENGDKEFQEYLNICKEKDSNVRRKRLDVTKQVQKQNIELGRAKEEIEGYMVELKQALKDTENARQQAEISKEDAIRSKIEAEKLRDVAVQDLDHLQKRTQFELMGKIVKVALWVILGVGVLTTLLFSYTLITGIENPILESTWSNLFGILLTNSFSIIGTIMGVKYASDK